MIGGLPLLQTLSITFSGAPIPFGKLQFPPKVLADLFLKIKQAIQGAKDRVNELKSDFVNPLKGSLDQVKAQLDGLTGNDFEGLKNALPSAFANPASTVIDARNELLAVIGNAQSAADQTFLGMKISDLSTLGATLYDAQQAFDNHTCELSGVASDNKAYTFERLYGTPTITGTTVSIYNADTLISPSLTATNYPIVNVGSVVIVNTQQRTIIGKEFTTHPTGTVLTTANSANLESSSLVYMNLANVLLQTTGSGTVKLAPNMYIRVNSEIRQINTINAMGDYLTVYHPFKYTAVDEPLEKEIGLRANAVFTTTVTAQIKIRTPLIANSICLDTIITGNGTTFTANVSVGDKLYYDNKEYFVINVTDTQIEVDDTLRGLSNQILYKVTDETPLSKFVEFNDPEDILGMFSSIDQLTGSIGANTTADLTTKYRAANGTYYAINASSPKDLTKSLQRTDLTSQASQQMQIVLDRLQDSAIQSLTDTELVQEIKDIKKDVIRIKDQFNDQIKADKAAINAVKGLLTGLLKLFSISCSKKKKKDGNTASDEFLELILAPNPVRQGCDATQSDFIDILDEIDAQHNTPDLIDPGYTPPDIQIEDPELYLPDEVENDIYGEEPPVVPGPDANIEIDPLPVVPDPIPDPCTQPC